MNFLQRVISKIAPACDHESELHGLRNQVQVALLERDAARGEVLVLTEEATATNLSLLDASRLEQRLRASIEEATHVAAEWKETAETHRTNSVRWRDEDVAVRQQLVEEYELRQKALETDVAHWKDVAELYRQQRDRLHMQWNELVDHHENVQARLADVTGQLEETTSAIAVLETRVRELTGPKQLPLVADREANPSDAPPADDTEEEVDNRILSLAFRLVGIFFDEGPGRRHHWHLERQGERVKVPIADAEFLKSVTQREQSFGARDTILGDFHCITWRKPNGDLRVEYRSCDRVNRIVHPDEPLSLDLQPEVAHV